MATIDIPEYLLEGTEAVSESTVAERVVSGCDGSSSCESGVFQTCNGVCQGCQMSSQCSTCQTTCEVSCQTTCQTTCQDCQGVSCQTCQTSCETYCQSCQGLCMSTCERSCQDCQGNVCLSTCMSDCQLACQSTCETSCQSCQGASCQTCQSSCQYSCQTTCQKSCQDCQTCQNACEYAVQTVSHYAWRFAPVAVGGNTSDTVVRGIWSGFVSGREVLCAACNGHLWELDDSGGTWSKTDCGEIDTSKDVFMFGFSRKLYLLNGSQYKVWDGEELKDVTGYRPLVSVSVPPAGGGTLLEQVNKLNGLRRARFSPDGSSKTFVLPESGTVDYVRSVATGADMTGWTGSSTSVTFTTAPAAGVNSIEIGWTVSQNSAETVRAMRWGELFNGAQDSRVFLCGDGSNKAIYSGLTYDGQPSAEYFPDLNEMEVGDANTPITGLIRHYGRMLCFKLDSAWSVYYDALTLTDGTVTAGFYVTPINRDVGNCAPGQVRLVENRPRTLDGRSVMEWKATSSYTGVAGDQTNAQRISQRVDSSIRGFDLQTARTFYDKLSHEYYVIGDDGTALVHNVDADAWYIYTGFDASCFIRYKDELYFGTPDGWLRHCSDDYYSDNGQAIDAYWESGSMSFERDFKRKYSAMLWVGIKPEDNGFLRVTAETDQKSDFAEYSFSTSSARAVPKMNRIKLKAKKFTYYKLILSNESSDTTATVVSADIRVRGTGYVR